MSPPTPVDPSGGPSRGSGCLVAAVAAIVLVAILFAVVALALLIIFPSVTQPPPPAPPPAKAVGRTMPELALQPATPGGRESFSANRFSTIDKPWRKKTPDPFGLLPSCTFV